MVILIGGGTASGKTTIARTYVAQEKEAGAQAPLLIHHDRYYRDIQNPIGHNFDEPAALDTQLLIEHLNALKMGQDAQLPIYDFPSHSRRVETERVSAPGGSLIIVEGILVHGIPELRALADMIIYVDAPADIRLIRRIKRDAIERGRTLESVLKQYLNTVRPMHELYVAPHNIDLSLVLDGTKPIEASVNKLRTAINSAI